MATVDETDSVLFVKLHVHVILCWFPVWPASQTVAKHETGIESAGIRSRETGGGGVIYLIQFTPSAITSKRSVMLFM